jgi:hypothetical protein
MLTHADDDRIMTDEDIVNAENISDLGWEPGSTPNEARLMACIRLLLEHAEGIKDGAIKVVIRRMWINQPSRLQPYYHLHGTRVLAVRESDVTDQIYFLDGDVISQQIDPIALSEGWRPE